MSNMNVPDMSIARTGLGPPPGHITYQGGPLVAVAPPPQMPTPERGKRQRVFGLVPAAPGAMFSLVRREVPKDTPTPKDISRARALLRTAEAQQRAAEATWAATATAGGQGDATKLREASAAGERAAMAKRTLAEMEALGAGRPIRVEMATVREPAEVADRLADAPPAYVCMHDGCRGKRWESEDALRRAHPTHQDMMRAQQAHVFAVLCDAPLDPLDADGERVGYVAPKGSDGTTLARAVEDAAEDDRAEAKIASLEAQLAEMRAMIEALTKKGGK